jgi:hypothetical protein
VLAARLDYAWPLAGAAALVLLTLAVPVCLPAVRNLRLRPAADDAGTVKVPGYSPPQRSWPAEAGAAGRRRNGSGLANSGHYR